MRNEWVVQGLIHDCSVDPASTSKSMKPLSPSIILSVISHLNAGKSHHKISTRVSVNIGAVSKVQKLHFPLLVDAIGGWSKILVDQDVRLTKDRIDLVRVNM